MRLHLGYIGPGSESLNKTVTCGTGYIVTMSMSRVEAVEQEVLIDLDNVRVALLLNLLPCAVEEDQSILLQPPFLTRRERHHTRRFHAADLGSLRRWRIGFLDVVIGRRALLRHRWRGRRRCRRARFLLTRGLR